MKTGYVLAKDREEAEYMASTMRTKPQIRKVKANGPQRYWHLKIFKLTIQAKEVKD